MRWHGGRIEVERGEIVILVSTNNCDAVYVEECGWKVYGHAEENDIK